jgi:hypothetical protein
VSLFDGVVTLGDQDVPVIIGLEEEGIRMSSGGEEIGEWADGDYSIDAADDGAYTITAEDESLRFVPTNPLLFAAGLNGGSAPIPESLEEPIGPRQIAEPTSKPGLQGDAPEPRAITLGVFYALAAITGALGLWALISLFV